MPWAYKFLKIAFMLCYTIFILSYQLILNSFDIVLSKALKKRTLQLTTYVDQCLSSLTM